MIYRVFHCFSMCALRRERDSNPRYSCPYTAFRVRPDRPLRHLSFLIVKRSVCLVLPCLLPSAFRLLHPALSPLHPGPLPSASRLLPPALSPPCTSPRNSRFGTANIDIFFIFLQFPVKKMRRNRNLSPKIPRKPLFTPKKTIFVDIPKCSIRGSAPFME